MLYHTFHDPIPQALTLRKVFRLSTEIRTSQIGELTRGWKFDARVVMDPHGLWYPCPRNWTIGQP